MTTSTLPPELTAMFREEMRETVQVMSKALHEIEGGPGAERVTALSHDVKRRLHNIKGAANSLAMHAVAKVAHAAETFLQRDGDEPSSTTLAGMFQVVSWLQDAADGAPADPTTILGVLGASISPSALPQPAAPEPPPLPPLPDIEGPFSTSEARTRAEVSTPSNPRVTGPAEDVVRVSAALLERVLSPLTSLVVARTESRFRAERLQQLSELASGLAQRAAGGPLELDDVAHLRALAADLDRETARLRQDSRRMGQALTTLEDHIHGMRLVSLSSLESPLALAVRDAALRTNKQVTLSFSAAGVQVDRRVLQALRPPLIHLVRNAVDHGIEPPSVRASSGKPRAGAVSIVVRSRGETVEIAVEDDGAGVDIELVKREAIARGLLSASKADALSLEEVLALLARPGFSTRSSVSEISGRGIGMDIVYKAVRELGGAVTLQSTAGHFTRFTLVVPVSMVTTRVLLVRGDDRLFALPLSGVVGTTRAGAADFFTLDNKPFLQVGGEPALVRRIVGPLSELPKLEGKACVVALTTPLGRVAVLVDEVLGEEEVVVRPLGPPLRHVRGVVGTTLAESGAVVVVLAPAEIRDVGVAEAPQRTKRVRPKRTILVVDDSITTRTLERHILERAGYSVRLANDGHEALAILRTDRFDLVVSDVDMPRLDGIGLVRAMRADSALESLPTILVTSRDDASDRQRGLAAGAQAYIVKGRFDQDVLLQTISSLLGDDT